MRARLKLTLLVILLQGVAFAESTVIRVDNENRLLTISQNLLDPWAYDDEVCVTRSNRDIACGLVKFSDPDSAIVKIEKLVEKIDKKQETNPERTSIELSLSYETPRQEDNVRLVMKNPKLGIRKTLRELAQTNPFNNEQIHISDPDPQRDEKNRIEELRKLKTEIYWDDNLNPVSAISLGIDYAWPFLEYTQSISAHSAMTVRAVKMNYPVGGGFLEGMGGFLTYNYYPMRPLRGLWFQAGTGLYSMNIQNGRMNATTWTASLIFTAGYRVVWKEILSFGFAGGFEYMPNVNMGSVTLDFSGVLPSFLLSAGYFF